MTRTARDERTFYEVAGEFTNRPGALADALGCDPLAPLDLLFSHARAEERRLIVEWMREEGLAFNDWRTHNSTQQLAVLIESGAHRKAP